MKRKLLKITSIVLLINILTTTLAPSISYALTAGPTSPEFSSFEPVDTTDMVNLATGDFNYNIPLIEVPGPEGGYPIALSYHAGTSPDEEASWVGLGWSLNPGAINRSVSGFPDDFNNVVSSIYDYKDADINESVSVGIGIAGVKFGLTYASDTYKGTGIGYEISYGFGAGSHTTGRDPYGNFISSSSVGINESVFKFLHFDASTIIDQNSGKGSDGSIGLTYGKSTLGASINTDGGKFFSVLGVSGASNKSAGTVSLDKKNFNITIPIGEFLSASIGYNYRRTWTSEQSLVGKFGTLYYPLSPDPNAHSFDSYPITYFASPNDWGGQVDKQLGGSLPAYDSYSVLGQGISGTMQPYILDNVSLFRQNRTKQKGEDLITVPDLNYYVLTSSNKKVNFKFKYEFSNSYTRNISTYSDPATVTDLNSIATDFDNVASYKSDGFNSSENHLAGSKHIEWFTVAQINDPSYNKNGFIVSTLPQSVNDHIVDDQIGGFMVTNESGVTYHYGIPVYAFDEYSYTSNGDRGTTYRKESNPQPYAYTWLLTAITGPDFIDRGVMGQVEANDWGYWVQFNYGKWTDKYKWRNPTTGYHKQLDQSTQFYSRGQKELYYLDAVVTRSHTAIFEKKIRNDAKGNMNYDIPDDDFKPKTTTDDPIYAPRGVDNALTGLTYTMEMPVSTLALNNIYLFENNTLNSYLLANAINSLSDINHKGDKFKEITFSGIFCTNLTRNGCNAQSAFTKTTPLPFNIKNVIDVDDTKLLTDMKAAAIKTISFVYDNSLCLHTSNSFANTNVLYGDNNNVLSAMITPVTDGKLTLKQIKTLGRGGVSVIPPTTFEYSSGLKNPDYNQEKRDYWGMYKSDYVAGDDENLSRATTDVSSQYVDAWSLVKINSAMGASINIDYESDDYNQVALARVNGLKVNTVEFIINPVFGTGRSVKLSFTNDINLPDYTPIKVGASFTFRGIARYKSETQNIVAQVPGQTPLCACDGADKDITDAYYWRYFNCNSLVVKTIGSNYIMCDFPTTSNTSTTFGSDNLLDVFITPLGSKEYSCSSYTIVSDGSSDTKHVYNFIEAPIFIGGELILPAFSKVQKGGGLRVKSLSTSISSENITYKTDYSYTNGATSFEPTSFNKTSFTLLDGSAQVNCMKNIAEQSAIQTYRTNFNYYLAAILSLSREVPSPGVVYGKVTIKSSSILNGQTNIAPEYKVYEFSTPGYLASSDVIQNMVQHEQARPAEVYQNSVLLSLNKITIRDYGQRIGNLKAVTTYDQNDQPINEVQNTYLEELATDNKNSTFITKLADNYSSQGRIDQIFNEARIIDYGSDNPIQQRVITRKEEYPTVLVKTTSTNHKTGITEETIFNSFDYYAGIPTEVINKDTYGNVYKTVSKLAYNQYDGMGLKVNNLSNKNMLSQNLSSTVYKVTSVTDYSPVGLVSSQVQTWSNQVQVLGPTNGIQNTVWRKRAGYSWIGSDNLNMDGTFTYSTYTNEPFTYWNGQDPSSTSMWQKNGEVTLYNTSSAVLESKDINSNYSSAKMDPFNRHTTFSATNASYSETAYSGSEYYSVSVSNDGGVNKNDGIINSIHVHTGNSSLEVAGNKEGFSYTLPANKFDATRKYRASVWVYFSGLSQDDISDAKLYYSIGGTEVITTPVASKKSKNWYLINLDINPSAAGSNNIIIGCRNTSTTGRSIYFDDFRVHPIDCGVASYVYDDQTNNLTYILNNDNLYTKFEYDEIGRLKRSSKEFFYYADKIISEQYYNYGKIYR